MAAFEGTRELIGRPGPQFVLTHSMAAHCPFSVDRDCGPLPSAIGDPELATDRARVAYVDGILCTDRAVLSLVTEILRRSPTPPVILLQGDHGPRGLGLPWLGDAATITAVQARGRFETFGAYYLPGAKRQLPDTVTPVTVVRAVLSDYFGADLPPLPDRSLHATMDHPYRFFVIPDALLRDSTPLARYGVTLEEHEHPRDP